jgi:hypothetical protein
MQSYKFYLLDERGRIAPSARHHVCADDLAALRKAQQLCGDTAIEIWHDNRRVAVVKKGNEALNERDARSL